MRRKIYSISLIVLALGSLGCFSKGVALPSPRSGMAMTVPVIQLVVVEAANQAVSQLRFPDLYEKKVHVTVTALTEHQDREILDYLRNSVEAKLAESNVHLSSRYSSDQQKDPEPPTGQDDVDYRIVVAVEAAGIDYMIDGFVLGYGKTALARVNIRVTAFPVQAGKYTSQRVKGQAARDLGTWLFGFLHLGGLYSR